MSDFLYNLNKKLKSGRSMPGDPKIIINFAADLTLLCSDYNFMFRL